MAELLVPYRPGPPPAPTSTPEQIIRATWAELEKIAVALTPVEEVTPADRGKW